MQDMDENIPPFIQDYLDKLEHAGYADFIKLSRKYQKEKEEYAGKFAAQSVNNNQYNPQTGKDHKLNYEDGLHRMEAEYKKSAYNLAKEHGYKGQDPFQPSDQEFTKQGDKFKNMIDNAKQQKQEQEPKFKQTQSAKPISEDPQRHRSEFLEKIKQSRQEITINRSREPNV